MPVIETVYQNSGPGQTVMRMNSEPAVQAVKTQSWMMKAFDQPVFARGQHGQQQQQVADQRDQRHDDEKAFVEGSYRAPFLPGLQAEQVEHDFARGAHRRHAAAGAGAA